MYISYICIYGKRKFVFLGRQTIDGNQRPLLHKRAHLCLYHQRIYSVFFNAIFVKTIKSKDFYIGKNIVLPPPPPSAEGGGISERMIWKWA